MLMEWPNNKVYSLIARYKERTLLWNPSDNYYHSKNRKVLAWKGLAKDMGTTVSEVQKKIQSLLASYRRERKKHRQRGEMPLWFAYRSLLFLAERNNRNKQAQATEIRDKQDSKDGRDMEFLDFESEMDTFDENHEIKEEINFDEESSTNTENENSEGAVVKYCESNNVGPPPIKKVKPVENTNPPVRIEETYSEAIPERSSSYSIESVHEKPTFILPETVHERPFAVQEAVHDRSFTVPETVHESKTKDDCDVYGELLARKLRKMDPRTRDVAMNKIDNLLFKMKMDSYNQQQDTHPVYYQYSMDPRPSHITSDL